jgi:probable HAF family extracellular repeat protein
MRAARLLATALLATVASCSEQTVPTVPQQLRPSFTYTASASAAVILDAYNSSSYTISYGINDLGVIAGVSDFSRAVRWETGTASSPTSIAPLLVSPGGIGRDINAFGQIAGESGVHAVLWTPDGGGGYTLTNIGSLLPGATFSAAYGINASGQVVGNYFDGTVSKCFLWTPTVVNGLTGTAVTLPDLGGNFCVGNDINTTGQIAGSSTVPSSGPHHAIIWSNSLALTDLLPGPDESYGSAINDAGQVAGYHTPAAAPTTAAVWTPNGSSWSLADLGTPALSGQTGLVLSAALDINDAGFVVGYTHTLDGIWRAFFWQDGIFTELPGPGSAIVQANALTNLIGNLAIVTGSDVFNVTDNYRHGLRWAVTLTTVNPEGCLAQLAQLVNDLRGNGVLSAGQASSLLGKVDAASRQADQGKTTAAKNVLYALINEVNAMRTSGRLSNTDAQALIDAAECAIAAL